MTGVQISSISVCFSAHSHYAASNDVLTIDANKADFAYFNTQDTLHGWGGQRWIDGDCMQQFLA